MTEKVLYVSTSRWSRRVLEPARARCGGAVAADVCFSIYVFEMKCPSVARGGACGGAAAVYGRAPGSARTGAAAPRARAAFLCRLFHLCLLIEGISYDTIK